MREIWVSVDEFPDYSVSNFGQVASPQGLIMKPTLIQNGIPTVGFVVNRRQFRRSIAPIVANAFLEPPKHETFDTPIQLDGNRSNCHVENLMWRPRWFAIQYHKDRLNPRFDRVMNKPFELVETGEEFYNFTEPVVKYGLLEKDVFYAYMNGNPVFPTFFHFRRIG